MVLLQELPDEYCPCRLSETCVFHLFVFQEASEALYAGKKGGGGNEGFQERECQQKNGIKLVME